MHGLVVAAAGSDPTTVTTLVFAAITAVLVIAALVLVLATRAEVAQARADARGELDLIRRQLEVEHRPLLVDVPLTAPGPTSETRFPELEPRPLDPGSVFVAFESDKVYISVPLRNVGRGLAAIDGGGVALTGPLAGAVEHRMVQREYVPAGETTRIDLVAPAAMRRGSDPPEQGSTTYDAGWQLTIPYSDFGGRQRAIARFQIVSRGHDMAGQWLVDHIAHEAPRGEVTPGDELPDRGSPERTDARPERAGVRGEPVVDLWGNPVRPRRRNR